MEAGICWIICDTCGKATSPLGVYGGLCGACLAQERWELTQAGARMMAELEGREDFPLSQSPDADQWKE
jgi:hypothetical protein